MVSGVECSIQKETALRQPVAKPAAACRRRNPDRMPQWLFLSLPEFKHYSYQHRLFNGFDSITPPKNSVCRQISHNSGLFKNQQASLFQACGPLLFSEIWRIAVIHAQPTRKQGLCNAIALQTNIFPKP
jgi:hypothetical protein